MHARQIFTVLSVLVLTTTAGAFSFQHIGPDQLGSESGMNVASGDVYSSVESQFAILNRKVHTRMPAGEKVALLRKTLEQIKNMREASPVDRVDREVEMDFTADALAPIATDPHFSVSKCEIYKAKLIINNEPYASVEEGPANPPLKKAYDIMKGICG